jgi:hypothetical protein
MLNRADKLAARDNYHGQATWRRIIEAVGQLVNKTLPGALHIDRKFFVPQIRSAARPLVSFLITDFSRPSGKPGATEPRQLHAWSGTLRPLRKMCMRLRGGNGMLTPYRLPNVMRKRSI